MTNAGSDRERERERELYMHIHKKLYELKLRRAVNVYLTIGETGFWAHCIIFSNVYSRKGGEATGGSESDQLYRSKRGTKLRIGWDREWDTDTRWKMLREREMKPGWPEATLMREYKTAKLAETEKPETLMLLFLVLSLETRISSFFI